MGRNSFDISTRLGWIRNACERLYSVPSTMENTVKGVPYVKVGKEGKVRVVIFAKTRIARVFYIVDRTGQQEHVDFTLQFPGNADDWVGQVAAFASGAAMAHMKNS